MLRHRQGRYDLSVIIPSCRPGKLDNCLVQLQRQRHGLAVQVVVVGEGDGPGIRRVAAARCDLLLCRPLGGNCGAAARDAGIRLARGDYLAFWDDDNEYYEHALATLYAAAHGYDVGVVQAEHRLANGGWLVIPARPAEIPTHGDIDTMCLCVRRELAVRHRWDEHRGRGTDYHWVSKLMLEHPSLRFVPVIIGKHL